jgi:hypothetical protein
LPVSETPNAIRTARGSGDCQSGKAATAGQEPPAIREGFGLFLRLARALANG